MFIFFFGNAASGLLLYPYIKRCVLLLSSTYSTNIMHEQKITKTAIFSTVKWGKKAEIQKIYDCLWLW